MLGMWAGLDLSKELDRMAAEERIARNPALHKADRYFNHNCHEHARSSSLGVFKLL